MFDFEPEILRELKAHQDSFDPSYYTTDNFPKWLKDAEDIEYRLFWCRLAKLGLADGFRIFIKRLPDMVSEVFKINSDEVNKDV